MRRRLAASAASISMAVITGILVNLLTDGGGWPIGAALIVAAVVWAAFDIALARVGRMTTTVTQHADGGSIEQSRIVASGSSTVTEVASGTGSVRRSSIKAADADVSRKATSGGKIVDGAIEARGKTP